MDDRRVKMEDFRAKITEALADKFEEDVTRMGVSKAKIIKIANRDKAEDFLDVFDVPRLLGGVKAKLLGMAEARFNEDVGSYGLDCAQTMRERDIEHICEVVDDAEAVLVNIHRELRVPRTIGVE